MADPLNVGARYQNQEVTISISDNGKTDKSERHETSVR
jgi:hypothetical protein